MNARSKQHIRTWNGLQLLAGESKLEATELSQNMHRPYTESQAPRGVLKEQTQTAHRELADPSQKPHKALARSIHSALTDPAQSTRRARRALTKHLAERTQMTHKSSRIAHTQTFAEHAQSTEVRPTHYCTSLQEDMNHTANSKTGKDSAWAR